MDKRKVINEIKQQYMIKRFHAQEKCESFINELKKDEKFNSLYTNLTKKQFELLRSELNDANKVLKDEIEEISKQIDKFLDDNHIDKQNLEPQYECKFCKDTGIYNGKMCDCLLNELNSKLSKNSSSQTAFKSFDNVNETIMDEGDKKACETLKTWCDKYPEIKKININLIGGSGSGKTFLLECVADAMIKKNCFVCFKTAFELNELARLYHIGKEFGFADCLNADILIIDDLGTEPVLKNVTKEYLYNLINVRQVNNKPTFISSNLTFDNLLDRYDERIFSRLMNKNLAINIQLTSKDKRIN